MRQDSQKFQPLKTTLQLLENKILLRFDPFKNVQNKSSYIANKIKNKYCSHNPVCHLSRFDLNNNNLLQLLLYLTIL